MVLIRKLDTAVNMMGKQQVENSSNFRTRSQVVVKAHYANAERRQNEWYHREQQILVQIEIYE
jgi:hypothetical protein